MFLYLGDRLPNKDHKPVPRPVYETQQSLSAERETIAEHPYFGSFQHVKLPLQYRMDFGCVDHTGRIKCFVEVKTRTTPKQHYRNFIISLSKIVAASAYERCGIPTYLLVKWTDSSGWIKLEEQKWEVRFGGRQDRGDWQDMEPLINIPVEQFN
tara:strand:- start:2913 stop:3374 length:462 start_codon:yes stop_codon:yes gene_type:complete